MLKNFISAGKSLMPSKCGNCFIFLCNLCAHLFSMTALTGKECADIHFVNGSCEIGTFLTLGQNVL